MQKYSVLTLSVVAAGTVAAETFGTLAGGTPAPGGSASGVYATAGASGDTVPLDVLGTAVVIAGGPIDVNQEVQVGAGGKAAAKSTGVVVGRAVTAAAADGDRIEVLLLPNVAA